MKEKLEAPRTSLTSFITACCFHFNQLQIGMRISMSTSTTPTTNAGIGKDMISCMLHFYPIDNFLIILLFLVIFVIIILVFKIVCIFILKFYNKLTSSIYDLSSSF